MNDQAASLQNLRDIVVPEPPPLWPPATGFWIALVVVLAVLLALFLWWRRARARNAYRRAGTALLADARTVRDVSVILKRVALAAFPRARVAPLYGEDWVEFLESTCGRTSFASIGKADPGDEASRELRKSARVWIRYHRGSAGAKSGGDG